MVQIFGRGVTGSMLTRCSSDGTAQRTRKTKREPGPNPVRGEAGSNDRIWFGEALDRGTDKRVGISIPGGVEDSLPISPRQTVMEPRASFNEGEARNVTYCSVICRRDGEIGLLGPDGKCGGYLRGGRDNRKAIHSIIAIRHRFPASVLLKV